MASERAQVILDQAGRDHRGVRFRGIEAAAVVSRDDPPDVRSQTIQTASQSLRDLADSASDPLERSDLLSRSNILLSKLKARDASFQLAEAEQELAVVREKERLQLFEAGDAAVEDGDVESVMETIELLGREPEDGFRTEAAVRQADNDANKMMGRLEEAAGNFAAARLAERADPEEIAAQLEAYGRKWGRPKREAQAMARAVLGEQAVDQFVSDYGKAASAWLVEWDDNAADRGNKRAALDEEYGLAQSRMKALLPFIGREAHEAGMAELAKARERLSVPANSEAELAEANLLAELSRPVLDLKATFRGKEDPGGVKKAALEAAVNEALDRAEAMRGDFPSVEAFDGAVKKLKAMATDPFAPGEPDGGTGGDGRDPDAGVPRDVLERQIGVGVDWTAPGATGGLLTSFSQAHKDAKNAMIINRGKGEVQTYNAIKDQFADALAVTYSFGPDGKFRRTQDENGRVRYQHGPDRSGYMAQVGENPFALELARAFRTRQTSYKSTAQDVELVVQAARMQAEFGGVVVAGSKDGAYLTLPPDTDRAAWEAQYGRGLAEYLLGTTIHGPDGQRADLLTPNMREGLGAVLNAPANADLKERADAPVEVRGAMLTGSHPPSQEAAKALKDQNQFAFMFADGAAPGFAQLALAQWKTSQKDEDGYKELMKDDDLLAKMTEEHGSAHLGRRMTLPLARQLAMQNLMKAAQIPTRDNRLVTPLEAFKQGARIVDRFTGETRTMRQSQEALAALTSQLEEDPLVLWEMGEVDDGQFGLENDSMLVTLPDADFVIVIPPRGGAVPVQGGPPAADTAERRAWYKREKRRLQTSRHRGRGWRPSPVPDTPDPHTR